MSNQETGILSDIDTPRTRVLKNLRQWIDQGHLVRGAALPSERMLAERLRVARGTVRSALDELRREGVIDGEGRGRRIVESSQVSRTNGLMADAVAVLTTASETTAAGVHITGWERFIEVGAFDEINERRLHAISLNPDRLLTNGLERLKEDRPLGVLVTRRAGETPAGRKIVAELTDAGVRLVVYGNGPEHARFDRVTSDHETGAYELTRWLISQGRKRILRLWSIPAQPLPYWLAGRNAGYERAMKEAGLEPLPAQYCELGSDSDISPRALELGSRAFAGYLAEHLASATPVDALMVVSDNDVFTAAHACRFFGKLPGQDVLVVGYDNYWPGSNFAKIEKSIPAATVDKLNQDIGKAMVAMLMDRVEGQLPDDPQLRLVKPRMIISGS